MTTQNTAVAELHSELRAVGFDPKNPGDRYVQIICPYHKDTSPSLTIYVDGGFICWGCGKRGTLYELIKDKAGDSEAKRRIGFIKKTKTPESKSRRLRRLIEKPDLEFLHEMMLLQYGECPASWLKSRRVSVVTGRIFNIRYDYVNDWIIFPLRSIEHSNRLVGMTRRIIDEIGGIEEQKYKNMMGFKPKHFLYGLTVDMEEEYDEVLIVEGQMDVVFLWEMGFHNVVGSFTSHISTEQAVLLGKRFDKFTFFYDNDPAGEKGFKDARKKLAPFGRVRKMPHLLEQDEEGNYLRNDAEDYTRGELHDLYGQRAID